MKVTNTRINGIESPFVSTPFEDRFQFVDKRMREQYEYIGNLEGKRRRGEITESRFDELFESALGVLDRFKIHAR